MSSTLRALIVPCVCLLAAGCGSGSATQLTIDRFEIRDAGPLLNVVIEVSGNGQVPSGVIAQLLRGERLVGEIPAVWSSGSTFTFDGSLEVVEVLDDSDSAPRGGAVDVPLTARVSGGGLSASRELTHRVSCGSDVAICAGACADLQADALHCGACGNDCVVQLAGSSYEGRCLGGTCNWPEVTVTVPARCASVCAGVRFQNKALSCVGRCSYNISGDAVSDPGVYSGVVLRTSGAGSTAFVLGDCNALPASSTVEGTFSRQGCCCGP